MLRVKFLKDRKSGSFTGLSTAASVHPLSLTLLGRRPHPPKAHRGVKRWGRIVCLWAYTTLGDLFFPAQFNVCEFLDPVMEVLYSCLNTWKCHSDVTLFHHLDSKHWWEQAKSSAHGYCLWAAGRAKPLACHLPVSALGLAASGKPQAPANNTGFGETSLMGSCVPGPLSMGQEVRRRMRGKQAVPSGLKDARWIRLWFPTFSFDTGCAILPGSWGFVSPPHSKIRTVLCGSCSAPLFLPMHTPCRHTAGVSWYHHVRHSSFSSGEKQASQNSVSLQNNVISTKSAEALM